MHARRLAPSAPQLRRPQRAGGFIGVTAALTLVFLVGLGALALGCGDDAGAPADVSAPPSCEGVTCSGHGQCALGEVGPVCACDGLYAGPACERCVSGYHRDQGGACAVDEVCEAFTCSGNGVCDDALGAVTCACSLGYVGVACADCAAAYHRIADGRCVADASCASANPCGPHGACDDAGGVLSCACAAAWTGERCERCAGGYHAAGDDCVADERCETDTCGGFGRCEVLAGLTACACDPGHSGRDCTACAFGYHQDGWGRCPVNVSCAQTNPCGPFASCRDAGGEVGCACAPGYGGWSCRACAPGFHLLETNLCAEDTTCRPGSCAGVGVCDASGGAPSCACDPGYTGAHCELCAEGHHRAADRVSCVADLACAAGACGDHGACDDSGGAPVCACELGYAGPDCAACASGYSALAGACVRDPACVASTCGAHGACDDSGGAPQCACEPGYVGPHCELCALGWHRDAAGACAADAVCDDASCSGHGACLVVDGVARCDCRYAWGGERCDVCAPGFVAAGPTSCVFVP